jgi:hypothetical protein
MTSNLETALINLSEELEGSIKQKVQIDGLLLVRVDT